MRYKLILSLLVAALTFTVRAGEKFPVLHAGTDTYTNVTVTKVTATDVFFTCTSGMANVKVKDLSPELQKHFSFGLPKSQAKAVKPAGNATQVQAPSPRPPATPPPAQKLAQPAPAPSGVNLLWRNDLPGVLKQAQTENKPVLVIFTASDWCLPCAQFDRDVLSTPAFASYARRKLLLVKADFPRHTPQSAELMQANAALAKQFLITGYPTYVLLNPKGQELGRQAGYLDGGPAALIIQLDEFDRH